MQQTEQDLKEQRDSYYYKCLHCDQTILNSYNCRECTLKGCKHCMLSSSLEEGQEYCHRQCKGVVDWVECINCNGNGYMDHVSHGVGEHHRVEHYRECWVCHGYGGYVKEVSKLKRISCIIA